MAYKGIVFDFDGVLIDSRGLQEFAMNESYKLIVGQGKPDIEEFHRMAGGSIPYIFKKMGLPVEMIEPYIEISRKNLDKIKLFPGMKNLLKELYLKDIKLALCTGKDSLRKNEILQYFNIRKYFAAVVGSDQVKNPKPDHESLILALAESGLRADDAIMIGDSCNDIRCAKSAGVRCIAVTWGVTDKRELLRELPDYICYSVEELNNLLFKLI